MSSYFMRRDGVLHGPYTFQQLTAAAKSGKLETSDEISRGENGPWTLAAKIPQLAPHLPEPAPAPPPPEENPFEFEEPVVSATPPYRNFNTAKPTPAPKTTVREGMQLSDLFDWKFTHFITPALNQSLYMLITGLLALAALVQLMILEVRLWSFFPKQEMIDRMLTIGAGVIILPLLTFVAWAIVQIVVRNAFEIALVLFRIEENTRRSR
jgi:hypothetical protein